MAGCCEHDHEPSGSVIMLGIVGPSGEMSAS